MLRKYVKLSTGKKSKKNSLLELEKDLMELKDRESEDRK